MLHANMIIYHAPDVLEFALDGRSLDKVQVASAGAVFRKIAALPDSTGPQVISTLYVEIFNTPSTPAPTLQRLERKHPL